MNQVKHIAIVGAGVSGALVAAQLILRAKSPIKIKLIEKAHTPGRGLAYDLPVQAYLLNVPARGMSVFPENPNHFVEWARVHFEDPTLNENAFLPRISFGVYVSQTLEVIIANRSELIDFENIKDEAVSLDEGGKLSLKTGRVLQTDYVVLATGNEPPPPPITLPDWLKNSGQFITDPWQPEALAHLEPQKPVLLIGTGLTMVDLVIGLKQRVFEGKIFAVSTNGLLPQTHQSYQPYGYFENWKERQNLPTSFSDVLTEFNKQLKFARQNNADWRGVIDGLRPYTATFWQGFSLKEKARFLYFFKHIWNAHRHRMAPPIGQEIDKLLINGQLQINAGRVSKIEPSENGLQISFKTKNETNFKLEGIQRIINCTGTETDYSRVNSALLNQLFNEGRIKPDPLKLGIQASPNGQISDSLFVVGPLMRGVSWEATAVPEIRLQALNLANLILNKLA